MHLKYLKRQSKYGVFLNRKVDLARRQKILTEIPDLISDVTHCDRKPEICHEDAKCVQDDLGIHSCECLQGYQGDGYYDCDGMSHSNRFFDLRYVCT